MNLFIDFCQRIYDQSLILHVYCGFIRVKSCSVASIVAREPKTSSFFSSSVRSLKREGISEDLFPWMVFRY